MNKLFTLTLTLLATVLFKIVHLYLNSFEIHAITIISKLVVFIFMMHIGDGSSCLAVHIEVSFCVRRKGIPNTGRYGCGRRAN